MAWRFTGRAKVDANYPQAFGVCDRCGFWYNLVNLNYQHAWRGERLMNIRLRVCSRCMDRPAAFLRPLILPPDPVPVADPRPQNFSVVGPVITVDQPVPIYLLDDAGHILTDDQGHPLLADDSPSLYPPAPTYPVPSPPPLPWPVYPSGPQVLPQYLLDDDGHILTDDFGRPLLADGSPFVPAPPFYVTPALPPLPPDIEWSEP